MSLELRAHVKFFLNLLLIVIFTIKPTGSMWCSLQVSLENHIVFLRETEFKLIKK
jgi:hypothetical protein